MSNDWQRMGRFDRTAYRVCRFIWRNVSRLLFRFEVRGRENLPTEGSFIAAPGGHRSYLDTPMMTVVSDRVLRFMGADVFFSKPVLGKFLDIMGGFPVDRDASDRAALDTAEEVVASGEPLVMFPEGARFMGPKLQDMKLGVPFIACRQQVPIVPIGLGGLERIMGKGAKFVKPTKCVAIVGEPIYPPEKVNGRVPRSAVKEFASELETKLQALFDEANAACSPNS